MRLPIPECICMCICMCRCRCSCSCRFWCRSICWDYWPGPPFSLTSYTRRATWHLAIVANVHNKHPCWQDQFYVINVAAHETNINHKVTKQELICCHLHIVTDTLRHEQMTPVLQTILTKKSFKNDCFIWIQVHGILTKRLMEFYEGGVDKWQHPMQTTNHNTLSYQGLYSLNIKPSNHQNSQSLKTTRLGVSISAAAETLFELHKNRTTLNLYCTASGNCEVW